MTSPLEGIPSELATADLLSGAVRLSVDSQLYPLGAVYAAAYVFLDRCYVLLDKPSEQLVRVTLTPKKAGADEASLRAFVGEFSNELLSAAWRRQIAQENRAVIEMVTSQAIAGAMGPPSLDDLAAFDFGDESFEDPLGIAMSWEEKYKKKDSAETSEKSEKPEEGAPTPEGKP
jgi:His-Xaa-Ser system protein HxsD